MPSWDILGNVIPFIGGGEEEKIETETNKILGALSGGVVAEPSGDSQRGRRRACRCRTATPASIAVALEQRPDRGRDHRGVERVPRQAAGARSAVGADSSRSSTSPSTTARSRRSTSNRDGGMTVTVGRLRRCPVLDYKFVALGHNTIRGAAGAAILNAELMHREGLL